MPKEVTQGAQKEQYTEPPGILSLHVIHALMLRDMRTRFGGKLWGYAIVVLWPCTHIFMVISIYTFQHIPVPVGDSSALFFAHWIRSSPHFSIYISRSY